MALKLTLPNCKVCDELLALDDGWLTVQHNPDYEAWKAEKAEAEEKSGGLVDFSDPEQLLRRLEGPRYDREWHWQHETCGDDGPYPVALRRIDTPDKVLSWICHLSEKGWFDIRPFMDAVTTAFPGIPSVNKA